MIVGFLLTFALTLAAWVPLYFMLRDPTKAALRRMPVPHVLPLDREEFSHPDWRGFA